MHLSPLVFLSLLVACDPKDTDTGSDTDPGSSDTGADTDAVDADGDGFDEDEDCDDSNAAISPGAAEVCDGIDNNCDDQVDDADPALEDAPLWYLDADADGAGGSETVAACEMPEDATKDATDCDDSDPAISPAAVEICDGIDNDCDSTVDSAGLVSWLGDDGTVSDYSSALAAGTEEAPAQVVLDAAGQLSMCEGTYFAHVSIESDVTIAGIGDVTISGGGVDTVVRVETAGVSAALWDLTLTGGLATTVFNDVAVGGGLLCSQAATVTLSGVDVIDNAGYIGAGIALQGGCGADLSDGTYSGNNASASGGSLYAVEATVTIDNVTFADTAAAGGAGISQTGGEITVTSSLFEGLSTNAGSAIFVGEGGALSLEGCTLQDNTANGSFGGAIWAYGASSLSITDTDLIGNTAPLYGGAIAMLGGGVLELSGGSVSSNSAGYFGGGIYIDTTVAASAKAVDFVKNSPNDLHSAAGYSFGTGASFTCSSGTCK